MKSEEEARKFFEIDLQSNTQPLENYRIKRVNKLKIYSILFSCFVLASFIFFFLAKLILAITIICTLVIAGILLQTLQTTLITLQNHFKADILPQFLGYLFGEYRYIPRQKLAKSIVEKSLLISYNIGLVEGADYMRFKIADTDIAFCEMNVYGYLNSNRILFRGLFISSSFNKTFSSQTIVISRKMSILIKNYQRIIDYQKVVLEDVEFNSEFIVYSSDQVESRYILTPGLMKRIVDYKQKTRKDISLSFTNNRLYLTIPNHVNLFEPALFTSFNNFDFMLKSYEALRLIADLVEDLHLNRRIWGK